MSHAAVTLATETVHNPSEPRHFMRIKPFARRVRVLLGEDLLAETTGALLIQEVGRDFYDPAYYIPRGDVVAALGANPTETHCPLKGNASYFNLLDATGAVHVEKIAWTYSAPIEPASDLAGRIAFYPSRVTFCDGPAG